MCFETTLHILICQLCFFNPCGVWLGKTGNKLDIFWPHA